MSNLAEKYSKLWIYLPVYLITLVLSIWIVYGYLNQKPKPEPIIVKEKPVAVEEKIPAEFLDCFEENKNELGGIFKITPTTKLFSDFEKMNDDCYDKICEELEAIGNGLSTSKSFYKTAAKKDKCFFPILNTSLKYHNQMLDKHPFQAFFYNLGEYKLTTKQKNELNIFLKLYKKNADKYGLLIIGRASKIGKDAPNKALSKKRSESIIEFIKKHNIKKLRYDFIYFGSAPPQLNEKMANRLEIEERDYSNISFGSGKDRDYALRLNQSVLLIVYPKKDNPFGLIEKE